jgi:uncharacterized membrane protein
MAGFVLQLTETTIAVTVHVLANVLWAGGFAYQLLAVTRVLKEGEMVPEAVSGMLRRFSIASVVYGLITVGSGLYMISLMGGMRAVPTNYHVKLLLGLVLLVKSLMFLLKINPALVKEPVTSPRKMIWLVLHVDALLFATAAALLATLN